MPGVCATCSHPQVREINHRIREGRSYEDIGRWLREIGTPITRQALARHHKGHLGDAPARAPGRKPISTDFLQAVVDDAAEQLAEGVIRATLRDGIGAQKALDERLSRNADRDLMAKIAIVLSGAAHPMLGARVIDPENEAIEAEFRPLLTAGD